MDSMPVQLSDRQIETLQNTERLTSILSLLGCSFIFLTFVLSAKFRTPFNRLVFYASWGNLLASIGTMLAETGETSSPSNLCQFQGFVLQFCMPVDVLMNMMIARYVYLAIIKNYRAADLRKLERNCLLLAYGVPFFFAFLYCFISTESRGKIYGPAVMWCWISPRWAFLRVATFYGPAWICIMISFTVYIMTGLEIFRKRRELRSFRKFSNASCINESQIQVPRASYQTRQVHISRKVIINPVRLLIQSFKTENSGTQNPNPIYDHYTVIHARTSSTKKPLRTQNHRPLAANAAAIAFTRCVVVFFCSMLITWVPASANCIYSLVYPNEIHWPLTLATGAFLPLMGFWNSLIYTIVSWGTIKALFSSPRRGPKELTGGGSGIRKMVRMASPGTSRVWERESDRVERGRGDDLEAGGEW